MLADMSCEPACRVLRMAHSVTVQPALAVRAALTPCHTDLQCLLLRLDLENQQVRVHQRSAVSVVLSRTYRPYVGPAVSCPSA